MGVAPRSLAQIQPDPRPIGRNQRLPRQGSNEPSPGGPCIPPVRPSPPHTSTAPPTRARPSGDGARSGCAGQPRSAAGAVTADMFGFSLSRLSKCRPGATRQGSPPVCHGLRRAAPFPPTHHPSQSLTRGATGPVEGFARERETATYRKETPMTTTSRTSRNASAPVKTPIPTPRRFLRCIGCGHQEGALRRPLLRVLPSQRHASEELVHLLRPPR